LAENIASVRAQTQPVECHLICGHPITAEEPQMQYVAAKNQLLSAVRTPWVATLNDDDVWLPDHVETVLPHLEDGDVVYTWDAGGSRPRHDYTGWTQEQLVEHFDETNLLDGNCLIRVSLLRGVGGFPVEWTGSGPWAGGHFIDSPARFEDWELWRRLARVGARFLCVPKETWQYGLGSPGQICG
jgi:hypothetical protein